LTYRQCAGLGGHIRKGEKSTMIVFWKFFEVEDGENALGEKCAKKIPMLRTYNVFNIEQCEDIPEKKIPVINYRNNEFDNIALCEQTIENWKDKPVIKHDGAERAYYRVVHDSVHMPKQQYFDSAEEYYSTMFHELIHSTGHDSRLGREMYNVKGDHEYSKEELIAEFGAAFTCALTGIENKVINNSASYIQGWLSKLTNKDNSRWLVCAAGAAQRAVDSIIGDNEGTDAVQ
jgi:antirestriction protein ArdC